MDTFDYVIGIDVAQASLSFSVYDGESHSIEEIVYEHRKVIDRLIDPYEGDRVLYVCESTGVYHQRLVRWIEAAGRSIEVVNPFVIRKYAEMRMQRAKTDAVDARLIAEYGKGIPHPVKRVSRTQEEIEIDQTVRLLEDLHDHATRVNNQLHALKHQAYPAKDIVSLYHEIRNMLQEKIEQAQKRLKTLMQEHFTQEYRLLQTIPGIGVMSSAVVIGLYGRFQTFGTAKQASAYAGLCPSPYQSGTSVKGRGSLSRRGHRLIRHIFYMAALSASRYNPYARAQYERLIAHGKSKKQALIAVANKLLRQAFAVIKSRKPFDPHYLEKRT